MSDAYLSENIDLQLAQNPDYLMVTYHDKGGFTFAIRVPVFAIREVIDAEKH